MITFIDYAKKYAFTHQNSTTRYIHMLSIPLILLSLMILLGFVHVSIPHVLDVSLAEIATVVLLVYYARLNWRLTLIITPIFALLLFIASVFSYEGPESFALWSFISIFLLGCILQLIGYFIEGKRPPLRDMLRQAWVAPLCVIMGLVFKIGRMQALKDDIYGKER